MDVLMPQMGETVAEGTLTVWHKNVGDVVSSSDILFEIGTDKVEMEVPALIDGILTEIFVQAGETVVVGSILAVIEAKGEKAASPKKPQTQQVERIQSASEVSFRKSPVRDRSMKLSPVVRKLLAENNLSYTDITGTGRDSRIKRSDVLDYLKTGGIPLSASATSQVVFNDAEDGITIIPFSYRRKMIAEHMVRSKATSSQRMRAILLARQCVTMTVTARATAATIQTQRHTASLTTRNIPSTRTRSAQLGTPSPTRGEGWCTSLRRLTNKRRVWRLSSSTASFQP